MPKKVKNCGNTLFEVPYSNASVVNIYLEVFYNQMVAKNRIDYVGNNKKQSGSNNGNEIQPIDVNSIRNKDVKEIGTEWLTYQTVNQLQIGQFLKYHC